MDLSKEKRFKVKILKHYKNVRSNMLVYFKQSKYNEWYERRSQYGLYDTKRSKGEIGDHPLNG